MATLEVGSRVRITDDAYTVTYRGKCGTVYAYTAAPLCPWHVKIDDDQTHQEQDIGGCAFLESELILLSSLKDALNNEDEATAVATNSFGDTIEVTYFANCCNYCDPFWIWQKADLDVVTEEDIHLTFDRPDMEEEIFTYYNLDANAPIWTRKQAEAQEEQEINFESRAHELTYVDPDDFLAGPFQGEADRSEQWQ